MSEQPWSVRIPVEGVPESGLKLQLIADQRTRQAVATAAGVAAVDRLQAEFELTRQGREGLRVVGQVLAAVEQTCVVSLEPLLKEISEDVVLTFSPNVSPDPWRSPTVSGGLSDDDPPEPLIDGLVDLGAVATEFLILGLDPYPRKAGIIFETPTESDSGNRPLAALSALKARQSTKE